MPIRVLKFGSSVLRGDGDLALAVREVERHRAGGRRVLAVVSALGATTDELLRRAEQLGLPPQPTALAALLATGESAASALLTLALAAAGIGATVLDPERADLRTRGDLLDGEPIAIDTATVRAHLATGVVVVPGFIGRDAVGRTALLGRGGSDLTALFLARELGAECTLLKDVAGLFTADPAVDPNARRLRTASWETACRLGGHLVQPKAIRFAQAAQLEFAIAAPGGGLGTRIGRGPDRLGRSQRGAGRSKHLALDHPLPGAAALEAEA